MTTAPGPAEDFVERMGAALRGAMPGRLGVELLEVAPGEARGRLVLQPQHLHAGGFAHSAAIACLAETVAACATVALLPEGQAFSTIEFNTNLFAAVQSGVLVAEARALHEGRRTVVLESRVVDQDGRPVALMIVTNALVDDADVMGDG